MDGLVCDRCGTSLLVHEAVRYTLDLRIMAAYDPMELTSRDLEADLRQKIADLIAMTDGLSARALAESVVADRHFDLCPPCGRAVLERPLGKAGPH